MHRANVAIPLMGLMSAMLCGCGHTTGATARLPATAHNAYLKASIRWRPNPPIPLKHWNLAVIATTRKGTPLPQTARVQVTIQMTTMQMPPIQDTLHWVSPGHYMGQVIIVMPGTLTLQISVTMKSESLTKTWMVVTAN